MQHVWQLVGSAGSGSVPVCQVKKATVVRYRTLAKVFVNCPAIGTGIEDAECARLAGAATPCCSTLAVE